MEGAVVIQRRGGRRWPALASTANFEAFRAIVSLETLSFLGS